MFRIDADHLDCLDKLNDDRKDFCLYSVMDDAEELFGYTTWGCIDEISIDTGENLNQ